MEVGEGGKERVCVFGGGLSGSMHFYSIEAQENRGLCVSEPMEWE